MDFLFGCYEAYKTQSCWPVFGTLDVLFIFANVLVVYDLVCMHTKDSEAL